MPEKSALPPGNFGAGPERFGFPSAVRGVRGSGRFSHCAESGSVVTLTMAIQAPAGEIDLNDAFLRCIVTSISGQPLATRAALLARVAHAWAAGEARHGRRRGRRFG